MSIKHYSSGAAVCTLISSQAFGGYYPQRGKGRMD
jgi:hypothetical protein